MKRFLVIITLLWIPLFLHAAPIDAEIDGPLARVRQFQPKNPGQAFHFHNVILAQRINRLKQAKFLPEDKKSELIAKFTEELDWFKQKQDELAAATTEDDRRAIRQEIIEHSQTARQEHQRDLAKEVALPAQSPVDMARGMATQFQTIAERFNNAELDSAIQEYTSTVTALAQAMDAVQQEKTFEHIRSLRDAITNTRTTGSEVRNLIESLVAEQ